MSWQDHLRAVIPDPLYNVLRAARDWISRARRSRTRWSRRLPAATAGPIN